MASDADLLTAKRKEVLAALVNHLDAKDDGAGLELLLELLEISNIQYTIVADRMAAIGAKL
jgi:hypothetical protein